LSNRHPCHGGGYTHHTQTALVFMTQDSGGCVGGGVGGGGPDEVSSCPIDILVMGADTLIIHRLLLFAAGFASRRVVHCTGQHLVASVTRDRHTNCVTCFLEGIHF